jgi:hypothetical protein
MLDFGELLLGQRKAQSGALLPARPAPEPLAPVDPFAADMETLTVEQIEQADDSHS